MTRTIKSLLIVAVLFTVLSYSATVYAGTVTGTIRYTDRELGTTGFTGTNRYLPIPYARVEFYRVDGPSDKVNIGSTNLNEFGWFSKTFTALQLPASTSFEVRLYSDCEDSNPNPIKVVTLSGAVFEIVFSGAGLVSSTLGDWSGNAGDLDTPATLTVSEGNSGPFNILFCIAHAAMVVASMEGGTFPPTCTTRWEAGSTTGSYTESISQNIYLLGDTTRDTDEFDDDVIVHEYGHFVSYNYTQDDSPGGYHYGAVTDLRLAWMEAWSGYFSAWANSETETWIAGSPVYHSRYVDTRVSGAASWDIEPPSATGFPGVYDNDEISVQSGLWDIFDPANESWDLAFTFSGATNGKTAIWQVYRSLGDLPGSTQVTFETFWTQWFALGYANRTAMDSIFLSKLGIDLYPDAFEDDDSSGTAKTVVVGDPATYRTFSPAADQDWLKFEVVSGKTYSVATSNLINGADTHLTVYNSSLGVLGTNDNRSVTTFESLVEFTAATGGTVYVKVTQISTRTYAQMGGYKVAVVASSGTVDPPPATGGGGGSGCFVATAAFGSIAADSVRALTYWRDCDLAESAIGDGMTCLYYVSSPSFAGAIAASHATRSFLRRLLGR